MQSEPHGSPPLVTPNMDKIDLARLKSEYETAGSVTGESYTYWKGFLGIIMHSYILLNKYKNNN